MTEVRWTGGIGRGKEGTRALVGKEEARALVSKEEAWAGIPHDDRHNILALRLHDLSYAHHPSTP